jgi:hypothetical protein
MSFAKVKKELNQLSKEQLIKLFQEMYKKLPAAKDYLEFFAQLDQSELVERYKAKLDACFYTRGGRPNLKFSEAKKIIKEFNKMEASSEYSIEVRLYFVQLGIDFGYEWGVMDITYYDTLFKHLDDSLLLAQREKLLPQFHEQVKYIVSKARSTGWWYDSCASDTYENFYPL